MTRTKVGRLDVFEMGMLRSIVGVRWDNFERNVDIGYRLYPSHVSLKLKHARLKWCGHIERMGDERQMRWVMKTSGQAANKPEGCDPKRFGEQWPERGSSCIGGSEL